MSYELKGEIVKKYGTQRRFAKAAGIPECELSNYLNKVKPWNPDHAAKARKCLGDSAKLIQENASA
jgi:hypothetical protein